MTCDRIKCCGQPESCVFGEPYTIKLGDVVRIVDPPEGWDVLDRLFRVVSVMGHHLRVEGMRDEGNALLLKSRFQLVSSEWQASPEDNPWEIEQAHWFEWKPDMKPTNPKDAVGSDKLPLHLWPKTATVGGSLALLDGMLKYGRSNWRSAGVRATIYVDALERHVTAYMEGEECDPDSGLPHLYHALACLAILVDAEAAGKLVDDRNFGGDGWRPFVESATPHVARLKGKHAGRDPRHFTIGDNTVEVGAEVR